MKPIATKAAEKKIERRKHRRYIVRGRTLIMIDSLEIWAELVNFGEGGLLLRSTFDLPVATRMELRIVASSYPIAVEATGQIVGGRGGLLAIQFVEKPAEAGRLLRWLEAEHYPWTGTFDDPEVDRQHGADRWESASIERAIKRPTARVEEDIFQTA